MMKAINVIGGRRNMTGARRSMTGGEEHDEARRSMTGGEEHDEARRNMTGASPVTTIYETGIGSRWAVFSMN